MAELTPKQTLFVAEYLGGANYNGAEAARRAGYSGRTARDQATELLSNPNNQAAIRTALAERSMPAEEVLVRKTEVARGLFKHPLEAYLNVHLDADGRGVWEYDWLAAKADGKLALPIEFVRCGKGELTRMMMDHQAAALESLAKAHRVGQSAPTEAGTLDALREVFNDGN